MTLAARLLVFRARRATRRAARERRRRLARDLAGYRTPAERGELEAICDRYPDGTTWELRQLLAQQALADHREQAQRRWPATGRP
jgi:hypothetical protein